MKLFYIPNFSKYRITKVGDIYKYDTMKMIYKNDTSNGLPKLNNDLEETVQLTRNDIASAFYGYLPNSHIESKFGGLDNSSKSIAYIIDSIEYLNDDEILINGNLFRRIEKCSRFYVSEYGVVYSTIMRAFKRYNMSKKYIMMQLATDGGSDRYAYVHHLVYEAFIVKRTPGMTINHKDERKWNNHYKNLNELTYGENTHYSRQKISDSYESILTSGTMTFHPELLEWMCEQMSIHNKSGSEICDMLGATQERDRSRIIGTLFKLRIGKGNPFISKKYDFSKYDPGDLRKKSLQKYTEPVYNAISYFIDNGFNNVEIGEILKIPRQTVYNYRKKIYLNNKEGSTTIERVS